MKYSLEIKQLVRFPYCRIYRSFIAQLTADPALRKHGDGLLFYFTVLFSLANYRTSYRTLAGVRFTLYAGELAAPYSELCGKMSLKYHYQLIRILSRLQEMHLIEYTLYPKKKLVKFHIGCWANTNTTLDYNAPCQKDLGFFFFPVDIAEELIGTGKNSEADILLDMWLHTVFNDSDVLASDAAPTVYYRDGSGKPLLNYADLAARWNISKTTAHRILKKLESKQLITIFSFPGKTGSVICLRTYLSTMFCVSDLAPAQSEISSKLAIELSVQLSEKIEPIPMGVVSGTLSFVPQDACSVPNPNVRRILENIRKSLFASGLRCSACPHALYRLSSLSDCTGDEYRYDLAIQCAGDGPQYHFGITLRFAPDGSKREVI